MKSIFTLAAVVCAFALHAAPQSVTLQKGQNFVNVPGEIVGIECMCVDATQVITAKVVCAVTEMTNAYKTVTVPHTRYDFVITNFDGAASISTNVLDNFSYSDWVTTNGTSKIVGSVKPVATNIAEVVADGTRAKETYTKEISVGNGTADEHYLLITPANTLPFFGGRIDVECNKQDIIKVLIK